MQFVDLKAQQLRIRDQINDRIQAVLEHGKYIMGPEVQEIETRLAEYVGIKHGISCSSGTDALLLALLSYGVGPGDAIFTSPFTFIATAEVISILGAVPVFVDIDPKTYNIDPQKLNDAVKKIKSSSLKPRGIIPVDLFGLPADYDEVKNIARENRLFVIGDAAQSFGSEYKGEKACSQADISCTSFFPAKPLGCYGDGGMCFTDNDELAEIMRSLRVHGKGSHKYDNERIGVNGRLDTIQAAILNAKFDIFPEEINLRQQVAQSYSDLFQADNVIPLTIPFIPNDYKSAWAQYSVLAESSQHRSLLQELLKENGIPTAIYYPKPLHLQTAFADLKYKEGDFPVSEDCSKRIFSLPMYPYLTIHDQSRVVAAINKLASSTS
jgi:UDP-2-acetamido-2-deoxy-ribo-hexuluronate aminotransferase